MAAREGNTKGEEGRHEKEGGREGGRQEKEGRAGGCC